MAYLLFAGDHYYPEGGAEDLQGKFDTIEEALAAHNPAAFEYDGGCANLLCIDTLEMVKLFNQGVWRDPYELELGPCERNKAIRGEIK